MIPSSKPVYEEIIDKIVSLIQDGTFSPGDRLPSERDFAEQMGVSRGSLREALRVLEQQNIVQTNAGGTRYISANCKSSLVMSQLYREIERTGSAHLLEARELLDDKVVELACQRATEEDLRMIENALEKQKWNFRENGTLDAEDEPLSTDNLFHSAIAAAAHNTVFSAYYSLSLIRLSQIRRSTLQLPGRPCEALKEHEMIYQAIRQRDMVMARLTSMLHLRNIRRLFDQLNGSGGTP
mgnify:CR=1 FL=1